MSNGMGLMWRAASNEKELYKIRDPSKSICHSSWLVYISCNSIIVDQQSP